MIYDSIKILASPWTGTPVRPSSGVSTNYCEPPRRGVPQYYHSQIVEHYDDTPQDRDDSPQPYEDDSLMESIVVFIAFVMAMGFVFGGLFLWIRLMLWLGGA